ncbi:MAG TPA: hypothetical protein VHY35_14040 [Stellaceae bacterium]|jgi:hypothetical protein|nr:hypothetical protein [Stellaceae bacterium]
MQRELLDHGAQRSFVVVSDNGDEVVKGDELTKGLLQPADDRAVVANLAAWERRRGYLTFKITDPLCRHAAV